MPSLADFRAGKLRRWLTYGAMFALLGGGCRHSTPDLSETAGARPLFPVLVGAAWGFIDGGGKVVIPPRFEAVLPFSEDLAAAKHEDRWGYINRSGAEVVPFRYRKAQSFHGGVAIVDTGLPEHPVGVIDARGSWVTPPLFRSLDAADGPDGLLLGSKEIGDLPAFYDRSGNLVLGPYSQAFPFSQGRARVKVNAHADEWLIDASGNFMPKLPVRLDGMRFSEGLIAVSGDGKLGYMDLNGNIAIEPRYDQAGEFAEGLAAVSLQGRWLFINTSGATVAQLPPEVVFAEPLSDGLSLVTANAGPSSRKFGYVGRNGQWAIKPVWDDAEPFHDDLAYVGAWKNAVNAYINAKGKRIWEGQSDRGAQLPAWWLTH